MGDQFDEMTKRERFVELVAAGVSPVNAGIEVDWSPMQTIRKMKDPEFADIILGAQQRANGSVEEALYSRALAGNVSAIQMWLFNREPDRWRDIKRIEVRSDHRISIGAIESVKAGVLELIRENGVGAMQGLEADDIIDAEIVDGQD